MSYEPLYVLICICTKPFISLTSKEKYGLVVWVEIQRELLKIFDPSLNGVLHVCVRARSCVHACMFRNSRQE